MLATTSEPAGRIYRGRIAPTPTGYLHFGHASTFHLAWKRARACGGTLVFREEDLDPHRCRKEFRSAAIEDLRAWGLDWEEGPDLGGPFAPYRQSERIDYFVEIWRRLKDGGFVYPSPHSRKEIGESVTAPQEGVSEVVFPPGLRPEMGTGQEEDVPGEQNWRFRVPDGERISFQDDRVGLCTFQAGKDFGDFLIWRRDGVPSYELAVVADDHAMGITEVVRGEDLLLSTARQLLIYRALGLTPPRWFHTPLIRDRDGHRLAKRSKALALRKLIREGYTRESEIDQILKTTGFQS